MKMRKANVDVRAARCRRTDFTPARREEKVLAWMMGASLVKSPLSEGEEVAVRSGTEPCWRRSASCRGHQKRSRCCQQRQPTSNRCKSMASTVAKKVISMP